MKKSLYLMLTIALLVAIALLKAIAYPPTIAVAQTSTVTVEFEIGQLAALNLGEDGLFDDRIDEMVVYYGIAEVDPTGLTVDSTFGAYEGNFAANDTQTEIPAIVLNVDPQNAVAISMVMIESDSGNFDVADYLASGVYDGNPRISERCTIAAVSSLLGLIVGGANLTDPSFGQSLMACLGDAESFLLVLSNGNDDLYTPFAYDLAPDQLRTGYLVEDTFLFEWAGLTNRSQYEMSYTISVE